MHSRMCLLSLLSTSLWCVLIMHTSSILFVGRCTFLGLGDVFSRPSLCLPTSLFNAHKFHSLLSLLSTSLYRVHIRYLTKDVCVLINVHKFHLVRGATTNVRQWFSIILLGLAHHNMGMHLGLRRAPNGRWAPHNMLKPSLPTPQDYDRTHSIGQTNTETFITNATSSNSEPTVKT